MHAQLLAMCAVALTISNIFPIPRNRLLIFMLHYRSLH